jgi:hypothetical protein
MFFKINCVIGFILIAGNFGAKQPPPPTKTFDNSKQLANIESQWEDKAVKAGKGSSHHFLLTRAMDHACSDQFYKRLPDAYDATLALGLEKAGSMLKAGDCLESLASRLHEKYKRLHVLNLMKEHPEIKDSSWPHQNRPNYNLPASSTLTAKEQRYLNEFFKELNAKPKGKEVEELLKREPVEEEKEFLEKNLAYAFIQKFANSL